MNERKIAFLSLAAIGCLIILAVNSLSLVYASGLYQETTTPIEGTVQQYKRAANGFISNPYGQIPSVEFSTEAITIYPDGKWITSFIRRVRLAFSDPSTIVPLKDPATGEEVGTITAGYAYMVMYSMWLEAERQADIPAPAIRGTNESHWIYSCSMCHYQQQVQRG